MKEKKSSIIDQYSHRGSYDIPDGYFADFAENFMQSQVPAPPTVWRKLRTWAYAASVVGAILLAGFGFVYLQDKLEEKNMEYLSAETYIETQLEELTEEELIEAILANNN